MKKVLIVLFICLSSFTTYNGTNKKVTLDELEVLKLTDHVNEIKSMIGADRKYSSKIAFLVDMKIKSGKNRFFVYDLQNNKILDQGLVANGIGSETAIRGDLKFSNVPNSKCTSLGRYAVEKSYVGMFGKAFRLNGLDETNNNAFKRAIVLHQYSAVPYEEQDHYIVNSQGCPMVNEVFFKRLEKIIESSDSKIVLSVYY
ncbi:murein L,D-transpeptidase catalytic domain-containing protein [Flavobacterium aquicola]|uniref:L,D-transpeptidase-like protein n=1 Tax=Flavobacterium aquicola TaxID=1682742 RepID=A0A3E0EVT9_9FLAO|nr:murein L,D-transpeptidase catalytic domain family protein [Flavobacterium aquicola]REH01560.1 L,D-transpeptidase-like protein [Flavobacterium aquicola]